MEKGGNEKAGTSPPPAPIMDELKEETPENALAKLEGRGAGGVRVVDNDEEKGKEKVVERDGHMILTNNGNNNGNANGKVDDEMPNGNGTAITV